MLGNLSEVIQNGEKLFQHYFGENVLSNTEHPLMFIKTKFKRFIPKNYLHFDEHLIEI